MIIVPALLVPGNVALNNVKNFLEKGIYDEQGDTSGKDLIINNQGAQIVQVTRRIGNKQVTFDIYDSVANFTESRWQRVVAVFVNGQDWQFKDWKNGQQKRELFARVRAYYMHYTGAKLPPQVMQWNNLKLELQRHKRHHDVNVKNMFWSDFE